MVERFQKILNIDAETLKKVTIVIDGYKTSGEIYKFALKGLSGKYETIQEFEETLDHYINEDARKGNALHFFIPFTMQEFRELTDTLHEAQPASRAGGYGGHDLAELRAASHGPQEREARDRPEMLCTFECTLSDQTSTSKVG